MEKTMLPLHSRSLLRVAKGLMAVGACWLTCIESTAAAVKLGEPFGEHMVLPRGVPVAIWGTNAPGGDTVRVSIAGQTAVARSDWQGRWRVLLAPMKPGGPYQMLIEVGGLGRLVPSPAAIPNGGAELNDVLIGEVISAVSAGEVLARPEKGEVPSPAPGAASRTHPYAWVRVWRAAKSMSPPYGSTEGSHWFYVAQDQAPLGSAALFELGRKTHDKQGVPVGVMEPVPVASKLETRRVLHARSSRGSSMASALTNAALP